MNSSNVLQEVCNKSENASRRPFKATEIWKDLVNHLQENAHVKRRRIMMKSHHECFSGSNAVEILLKYVHDNPTKFPNTSIVSHENIVRLCQTFIDAGVFESVNFGDDPKKYKRFENSSSSLYRFISKKKTVGNCGSEVLPSTSGSIDLLIKFSTLISLKTTDTYSKQKSVFLHTGSKTIRQKNRNKPAAETPTSESDTENQPLKKTPLQCRRNSVFSGLVMKRSSSDSNLRKESTTTSSSESDCNLKIWSPGDMHEKNKSGLSQRLSFRKKSLRRSGHSSYRLVQPCVIQNPVVAKDRFDATPKNDLKRKSYKENSEIMSTNKVSFLHNRKKLKKLNQQESSHIKRESVRVRLLQILDLPFVETFVISPTFDKKIMSIQHGSSDQSIRFTEMHYKDVASSYNSQDQWIFTSLSVMQHIPNSYNILRNIARADEHCKKIELYFAVSDHYNALSHPLIDEHYNGIAEGIIALLASKSVEKIMEAMQLFLNLLPDSRLTELRHLCSFLHVVCSQNDPKLVRKRSNQALVIDSFTPAILRLPEHAALVNGLDGCKGIVRFVILHHLRAFMLPAHIEMIVQRKIDLLEQGDIDSPSLLQDTTFCSMISESEYEEERVNYTRAQIQNLYQYLKENTSISARRKKDLLKRFERNHALELCINNNEDQGSTQSVIKENTTTLSSPFMISSKPKRQGGIVPSDSYNQLTLHSGVSGKPPTSPRNNINLKRKSNCSKANSKLQYKYSPSSRPMRITPPYSDPLTRKNPKPHK